MNRSVGLIENKDVKLCSGCGKLIPAGRQCLYKYERGVKYYCSDCTCNMLKVTIEDRLIEKEYERRQDEKEKHKEDEEMYNSAIINGFADWLNSLFSRF